MAKVDMHTNNDSVGPLNIEDQLNSLRGQINEIKEHIDLLILQSAIVRDRRSLLQHQQDIKPPEIAQELGSTCPETSSIKPLEITEELDSTCLETISINLLSMKGIHDSVVSGTLTLTGSPTSHLPSELIVTTPSDNIVDVQPPTQSQGSTSKLSAKSRKYKPGRCDFQGRSAPLEPPALFQGWVDAIC